MQAIGRKQIQQHDKGKIGETWWDRISCCREMFELKSEQRQELGQVCVVSCLVC